MAIVFPSLIWRQRSRIMKGKQIEFANVQLSNDNPFVLFGGLNVLESRELSLRVAETFKVVCEDLDIPLVDINDALRTVICNSKIKINPYNIAKNNGYFDINLPENIKGSLANLIIVKTLTNIGLKYKSNSCKLEVEGNERTICFHY